MRRFLTALVMVGMLLSGSMSAVAAVDDAAAEETAADELSLNELKVNINKDDAATLAAMLDGIGLKRAEAIVRYREAHGPFGDVSELAEVKGIGASTVANNASRIEVD